MREVKLRPHLPALPESSSRRAAIVDADTICLQRIVSAFERGRWDVVALDKLNPKAISSVSADIFVIDICPRGIPRPELIGAARTRNPDARVFAMTAYPSMSLAIAATRAGAEDCFPKPLLPEALLDIANGGSTPSSSYRLPSLARIEWDFIASVLQTVSGNISKAARVLGIQRSTLHRKLKKYPPPW
jgi:two-component system, response regulator RegA